jgi:guanylate kinase
MNRMNSCLSLVISAPSGAGKTTIIRRLMERDTRLSFSVSSTTRAPRDGEIPGKSYHYVSEDEFTKSIDSDGFVEWAKVHVNYYGTSRKELDRIRGAGKIPLFDVDVQGAKNLKVRLPDAVLVFIMPPSISALSERLIGRNTEGSDELDVRISNARGEMNESDHYDYVVINDVVEDAVDDILSIIRAESLKRKNMTGIVSKIMED